MRVLILVLVVFLSVAAVQGKGKGKNKGVCVDPDQMIKICAAGSALEQKAPAAMEACNVQSVESGRALGELLFNFIDKKNLINDLKTLSWTCEQRSQKEKVKERGKERVMEEKQNAGKLCKP